MTGHKKQIGLVLGSGGARGLAHVGVIKAFGENNIPIDLIAGTSIGALIGGVFASGMDIKSIEEMVCNVDKMKVAKIMIPKLFSPGFIDNKNVREFIVELVGDVKIENLKIPFASVATDFISGEEVIFNKGSLVDAILASIAIPTIFQPVLINESYFIDGGLSNPLPVSVAMQMKARKILAVNVSPDPKRITKKVKRKKTEEIKNLVISLSEKFSNVLYENKIIPANYKPAVKKKQTIPAQIYSPSMIHVFLQSVSISTNNLIKQQLRYAEPDILISPRVEDFDLLDFYKGEEIIKCGYNAALKEIERIKSIL